MEIKPWYQRRTVWAALTMVAVALASVVLELPADKVAAIEAALAAVALVFLRDGVEQSKRGPSAAASLLLLVTLSGCCSYPDTRPTLRVLDRVLARLEGDYQDESPRALGVGLRRSRVALIVDARATVAEALGDGR